MEKKIFQMPCDFLLAKFSSSTTEKHQLDHSDPANLAGYYVTRSSVRYEIPSSCSFYCRLLVVTILTSLDSSSKDKKVY